MTAKCVVSVSKKKYGAMRTAKLNGIAFLSCVYRVYTGSYRVGWEVSGTVYEPKK